MAVWSIFKRIKETWDWLGLAWQIAGLFGLTGIAVSVGGTVWAMILGLPGPFILMAAFCTFVAAVWLAIIPLAFRALAIPKERTGASKVRKPNYEALRHINQFTLGDAAHLWIEIDPLASDTYDTISWQNALEASVKMGEIEVVPQRFGRNAVEEERQNANGHTIVTRDGLKKFAKKYGYDPAFLREA